jgi:type VI secretion system protein VasD
MHLFRLFSGLIVASALAGCAGPRPLMPAPYTVVISADADVNPDRENRATPVQVRLLELKNSASFESTDFYTLLDKDEQALGADVLSREQLTLQPGQTITLARKAKTDARMLGVFVAFKNIEKSAWRAVTPLPQAKELGRFGIFNPSFKAATVTVRVGAQSVTAKTTGTDVPVPIPGTGGLPKVSTPNLPSAPSVPSVPSNISMPSIPSLPFSGDK